MNVRFGLLAMIASATLATAAPSARAQAQARKPIETRSAQSRGTGTDQNIKSDEATNAKDQHVAAPQNKGGAKTRGAAVGQLHVDNRTEWFIRVYVDGAYVGTLAPFGDWYANGHCDSFALYAVARFTDGSNRTWGPVSTGSGCDSEKWTLRP